MKTLVAQLWDYPSVIGDYNNHTREIEHFWEPCIESVKSWAAKNKYDYKRYSYSNLEHLLPDLTYIEDYITPADKPAGNWARVCISRLRILNNKKNDRVLRLDADIFVWGDPKLYDGKFCVHTGDRQFLTLPYPQGAVYYSTIGPQVYQWICEQLKNPGELLQLIRNFIKYSKKPTTHFTDQTLLCAYINSNPYTEIDNHVYWNREPIHPDTFVHFGGTNKLEKFRKFKAAMIYAKLDKFWDLSQVELKTKGLI